MMICWHSLSAAHPIPCLLLALILISLTGSGFKDRLSRNWGERIYFLPAKIQNLQNNSAKSKSFPTDIPVLPKSLRITLLKKMSFLFIMSFCCSSSFGLPHCFLPYRLVSFLLTVLPYPETVPVYIHIHIPMDIGSVTVPKKVSIPVPVNV